jgi:hypothetical protein
VGLRRQRRDERSLPRQHLGRRDPPPSRHRRQRIVRDRIARRAARRVEFRHQEHRGDGVRRGGPTSCTGNGIREKLGHFSIGGDGSSGGFVADGVGFHGNAYSNLCANEHYVAVFGDDENSGCAKDHEIKNSKIVQDNRFTINDDSDSWGGGDTESGCGWYVHDNRVDIVSNPGCSGQGCRKGFIRFKSVDSLQGGTRKKQFRVVNNDFTWETSTTDANFPWFIHTECIGECGPYNPASANSGSTETSSTIALEPPARPSSAATLH